MAVVSSVRSSSVIASLGVLGGAGILAYLGSQGAPITRTSTSPSIPMSSLSSGPSWERCSSPSSCSPSSSSERWRFSSRAQ
jgi:hypothetical protein